MHKEQNLAVFLIVSAFALPIILFIAAIVNYFEITIKWIDEIPLYALVLFILVFWVSLISYPLLLGWYIIKKVNQGSMDSITWLEEKENQESSNLETNGEPRAEFIDNNALSQP